MMVNYNYNYGYIKYDHDKLADILLKKYHDKYTGSPAKTAERLIDCMDDEFIEQWRKEVDEFEREFVNETTLVVTQANATISELKKELSEKIKENNKSAEEAKEAKLIHDEKVVDALKAYQTIVEMDFDTPQQKLQNIQNASYFIWALYFQSGESQNVLLNGVVTDVKKESDRSIDFRNIPRI